MAVVYLQAVEGLVASDEFGVHHAAEIQIHAAVGVGGNVTAVVCQQEAEAGVEVVVAVGRTACLFVRRFVHQELAGLRQVVIIDVYLRSGKDIAVAQPEEEPGVDLHAAVSVFAGTVASYVIFIGIIADAVKVFFRIFIAKLSEDTETVTLEEELRLGEKIDATVEHEGDGHGHYGAQLRGVAGVYAEGHQGASSQHGTEVGSVAGSTQNIVMQIPARYLLLA